MMTVTRNIWLLVLGLIAAQQSVETSYAQELPDVARPQTGGEWAQVYTPVGEVLGGTGIQPFMEAVELKGGDGLVQLTRLY